METKVRTVHETKDLPKFMLLFTPDETVDTIRARLWWEPSEILFFETKTNKFYVVPMEADFEQVAERFGSGGGIGNARQAKRRLSEPGKAVSSIQRDSNNEKTGVRRNTNATKRSSVPKSGRGNEGRRSSKRKST